MISKDQADIIRSKLRLPKGIDIYEVDGQWIFPVIYHATGLGATCLIYFINSDWKEIEKLFVYCFEFNDIVIMDGDRILVQYLNLAIAEFLTRLKTGKAREVDPRGGSLGRGDNLG